MSVLLEVPIYWGDTPEDCVKEYDRLIPTLKLSFDTIMHTAQEFRLKADKYKYKKGWPAIRNWLAKQRGKDA